MITDKWLYLIQIIQITNCFSLGMRSCSWVGRPQDKEEGVGSCSHGTAPLWTPLPRKMGTICVPPQPQSFEDSWKNEKPVKAFYLECKLRVGGTSPRPQHCLWFLPPVAHPAPFLPEARCVLSSASYPPALPSEAPAEVCVPERASHFSLSVYGSVLWLNLPLEPLQGSMVMKKVHVYWKPLKKSSQDLVCAGYCAEHLTSHPINSQNGLQGGIFIPPSWSVYHELPRRQHCSKSWGQKWTKWGLSLFPRSFHTDSKEISISRGRC